MTKLRQCGCKRYFCKEVDTKEECNRFKSWKNTKNYGEIKQRKSNEAFFILDELTEKMKKGERVMNECMFNNTTDVNCMLGCTGCAGRITKEDLKNYLNNKKFFRDRLAEYKEDLRIAEDLKAVVLDGMPKSHNKTSYALEETLDKINELIQEENKELDKLILIDKKLKMMKNTTYRNILYKKYIKGESLEQISTDMHYDYKHLCKLHGYALLEFDKI